MRGMKSLPWTCQSVSGWWARTGAAIYRQLACEGPEGCRCRREHRPYRGTRSCHHHPPSLRRHCPQSTLHQIPSKSFVWNVCNIYFRHVSFFSFKQHEREDSRSLKSSDGRLKEVWKIKSHVRLFFFIQKIILIFQISLHVIRTLELATLELDLIFRRSVEKIFFSFVFSLLCSHLDLYTAVSAVAFGISGGFVAFLPLFAAPPNKWAKSKHTYSVKSCSYNLLFSR